MDVKKLNIPTLEGPNWGKYAPKLQAAFWIFDCWDVVKGEILTPAPNHLPAIGQFGENSNHWLDGPIVTNTTISRQLQ